MEDGAEIAEGLLGGHGGVSGDAGFVFQGGDNDVDDFGIVVVEGLRCAERFEKVVILSAGDAEDFVASLCCELLDNFRVSISPFGLVLESGARSQEAEKVSGPPDMLKRGIFEVER